MSVAVLLRASHSHLYPGSIVTLDDAPRIEKPHPAIIEFAGGSGVAATLASPDDDTFELAVDEYRDERYFFLKIRAAFPGNPR
ncbi:hypothetical protein CUJ89_03815 [Burkholderia pyrrocinia]|uniref:Uncharacterized protein n=1 Tax=Burkholderia pyrrocinia TaxID=60550 RepID=A0A2Z5MTD6_BURPY|nr:hypothetical protein CUJ89_03815 [Burkholderia pyrrocinia]